MPSPCAILLACAALQSPAPPPVKAAPEWEVIDQVVAIVNQDVITYRQLMRDLSREKDKRNLGNASEMQAAQTRILTQRVKQLLAKQAGQDMGADEKLVERNVQDSFDRIVLNNNGVVGMSKIMQGQDMNTQDVKKALREDLYTKVWEESITGEGAGLAARPNRDRYQRPGELKFRYERALRDPDGLRRIGGSTDAVTMQTLSLDSDKHGGRDATMALARDLKKAIAADADMNELVGRYSAAKENNGIGAPAEITRLRQIAPALAQFVDARPADPALWPKYVSEPIIVSDTGTRVVVLLARIREWTPAVTPRLDSSQTQERLTKLSRDSLDDYRLERAFVRLHQAAYVWPPEYAAAPQR